jgi:hypothetical protein
LNFENCALLIYDTASSDNFLPTFRERLSVPSSLAPEDRTGKSVRNYHYSLHHNPEERSSHPLRGVTMKSQIDFFYYQYIQPQSGFAFAKAFYLRGCFMCHSLHFRNKEA